MAKPKTLIISLSEAAGLLREVFRDQAEYRLQTRKFGGVQLKNPLNYDCNPYMMLLVEEMFHTVDRNLTATQIWPSTRTLIADGLDEETAVAVSLKAFEIVVDEVSRWIPDIQFGQTDHYITGFCDGCDLMVTIPELDEET